MASAYKRVRMAQASKAIGVARRGRLINSATMLAGSVAMAFSPVGGGLLMLSGYLGDRQHAAAEKGAIRSAVKAKAIGAIIQRSQRAKAAAASISRARGVMAKTAASRNAAASRSIVPRPVGQRKSGTERKASDGQTKGYYRNQGGQRVFVQGYSTPKR